MSRQAVRDCLEETRILPSVRVNGGELKRFAAETV